MLLRIVGSSPDADVLLQRIQVSLEELGLSSHTQVELYDTPEYRESMHIANPPALCVEESEIDFRDMLFEGLVPEQEELTNLFISLFGTEENSIKGGCATCSGGGCETCGIK